MPAGRGEDLKRHLCPLVPHRRPRALVFGSDRKEKRERLGRSFVKCGVAVDLARKRVPARARKSGHIESGVKPVERHPATFDSQLMRVTGNTRCTASRPCALASTVTAPRPRGSTMHNRSAMFVDPPPLKWSDLRYVFDIQEDCNGKEAIQA
jgi:hypothetical protein